MISQSHRDSGGSWLKDCIPVYRDDRFVTSVRIRLHQYIHSLEVLVTLSQSWDTYSLERAMVTLLVNLTWPFT